MVTKHSAQNVYKRCLYEHGRALWIPEPDESLPDAYKLQGVSVGDVGVFTPHGGFDFLYNIHRARDDPLNFRIPPDFQPVPLTEPPVTISKWQKGNSALASSKVVSRSFVIGGSVTALPPAGGGFGFEFTTDTSEAAILVLPHGAARYDARNLAIYSRYAAEHGVSLYQYVNGTLGREATNGSIFIVTGCDKCPSWGMAAVSKPKSIREVSLSFVAGGLAEGRLAIQKSCTLNAGVSMRSSHEDAASASLAIEGVLNLIDPPVNDTPASPGKAPPLSPSAFSTPAKAESPPLMIPGANDPPNQCIFIRGVSIVLKKIRFLFFRFRTSGVPHITRSETDLSASIESSYLRPVRFFPSPESASSEYVLSESDDGSAGDNRSEGRASESPSPPAEESTEEIVYSWSADDFDVGRIWRSQGQAAQFPMPPAEGPTGPMVDDLLEGKSGVRPAGGSQSEGRASQSPSPPSEASTEDIFDDLLSKDEDEITPPPSPSEFPRPWWCEESSDNGSEHGSITNPAEYIGDHILSKCPSVDTAVILDETWIAAAKECDDGPNDLEALLQKVIELNIIEEVDGVVALRAKDSVGVDEESGAKNVTGNRWAIGCE